MSYITVKKTPQTHERKRHIQTKEDTTNRRKKTPQIDERIRHKQTKEDATYRRKKTLQTHERRRHKHAKEERGKTKEDRRASNLPVLQVISQIPRTLK